MIPVCTSITKLYANCEICKTKNCVILKGIHPDKIKDKIFEKPEDHFNHNHDATKCFKLVEEVAICENESLTV